VDIEKIRLSVQGKKQPSIEFFINVQTVRKMENEVKSEILHNLELKATARNGPSNSDYGGQGWLPQPDCRALFWSRMSSRGRGNSSCGMAGGRRSDGVAREGGCVSTGRLRHGKGALLRREEWLSCEWRCQLLL
jgi:hypothetical protein